MNLYGVANELGTGSPVYQYLQQLRQIPAPPPPAQNFVQSNSSTYSGPPIVVTGAAIVPLVQAAVTSAGGTRLLVTASVAGIFSQGVAPPPIDSITYYLYLNGALVSRGQVNAVQGGTSFAITESLASVAGINTVELRASVSLPADRLTIDPTGGGPEFATIVVTEVRT